MINLLVGRSWDTAGPCIGTEQDLKGLLEPPGAVTEWDDVEWMTNSAGWGSRDFRHIELNSCREAKMAGAKPPG